MSSRRRIAAGLSLLALFLTSSANAVQLQIAPAPGYERVAANIAAIPRERFDRARGLMGAPELAVAVQIISESEAQERRIPSWVSGYAVSEAMTIVLIPARAVTYPNDEMDDVVVHEVAHLMIDAAAGGRPVPRWFHEGVAMYATTGWNLEDTTRLTFTMWSAAPSSPAAIDRAFYADYGSVAGAYALSGALVRHLVEKHDATVIAQVLTRVRNGAEFDTAYAEVTGDSLNESFGEFWRTQTRWRRFVPILSSSIALWLGVAILAVVAFHRRRRRDAQRRAEWEEEERKEEEPSGYNL